MPLYRTGQSVLYKPVGGRESHTSQSIGTVKSVLTEPGVQAHHNVYASEDDPRYEIENENTGKTTTVYEKNILGIV